MMQRTISLILVVMATALAAAQPPDDRPRPRPPAGPRDGQRQPGPPEFGGPNVLVEALDADDDGVISAEEIAKAPESLLRLDRNGDGELRRNEWMPRPRRGDAADQPGPRFRAERPGPPENADRPGRGRRDERDRPGPPGEGPARRRGGENPGPLGGRFVDRVMQFDEDGDGQLSPDEIPERLLPIMEEADTNEDGLIDRDELQAVAEQMRERFREGRGGPPRPSRPAAEDEPGDDRP